MTPFERKPMILVIAGPNGSGKSTITQFFDTVGTYTNADDVVKTTGMSVCDAAKFERVNARVASGGHEVPEDKIVSRYYDSISNIKKLIELCDILHVYDNSLDKPVRIIRKHKSEFSIYPNKLWPQTKILDLLKS